MQTKDEVVYNLFMEMLPREKRRKYIKFMANNQPVTKKEIEKHEKDYRNFYGGDYDNTYLNEKKEFYAAFEKYVSEEFIFKTWFAIYRSRRRSKANYSQMPKPDRRDNKELRVGSGGSNRINVRFPRKTAGKATWKKFYKLFPLYEGFKTLNDWEKAMNAKYKAEQEASALQNEIENE